MPLFATLNMPGLGPSVFIYPVGTMLALFALFIGFFWRHPNAAPPVDPDNDVDVEEETPVAESPVRTFTKVHYDRVVPALIAASFYLFGLWRLGYPPKQVFDEVHHVRTSMEFVLGQNPHEWTHPHVAKLVAAFSMYVSGERFDPTDGHWDADMTFPPRAAISWRLPSLIFGTLALLGQYVLARALFKNRAIATMAMLFLALDGVFFVESRIEMTNIYTVCFILWGAWGTWRWVEEQHPRHLYAGGAFLGLAIASRWSSLYAYLWIVIFLLVDAVIRWSARKFSVGFFLSRAGLFISALILLPLTLYIISYIPFVLQGAYGTYAQKLFTWDFNGHGWGKVLSMQGDMYHYHSTLNVQHDYNSPPWSWPLMLRPVWYYFQQTGPPGHETVYAIWCIGNAMLWWAMIPSLGLAIYLAIRQKRGNLAYVVLVGIGQWFLWLAKARGLNFMHYLLEAIPFVCIALAYLLLTIWESGGPQGKSEEPVIESVEPLEDTDLDESFTWWRLAVAAYVFLIVAWFVCYYPMLAAYPIPGVYSSMHFLLGRIWI